MLDFLACVLVRGIGWILCRIPTEVAVWAGERLGLLAYLLQPRRTRIGTQNLRAAFDGELSPAQVRRIILSCYRQMGAAVVELLRLPVVDQAYVERYVTFEGLENLKSAVASGRPVIMLSGHYGNWEFSSIVGALIGYPMLVLARLQDKFPKLYRLLVSHRESKGCIVVHKGGAIRHLITALEQGRIIGIVGDQASRQGHFVDFFGRPALFAKGPFELAYRKRALIVWGIIRRIRGPFHRAILEPAIDLSQYAKESEAVKGGIERFASMLARRIREEPGQWLWMHKRWKHTPARLVLVLSDGKRGHLKQSLAVCNGLRESCQDVSHCVLEVRYRGGLARAAAVLWGFLLPGLGRELCLRLTLTPESSGSLLSRYADIIVSCGSSLAPANLLWAKANSAKSIVIMNPAPLPLKRFDLVIAPRHDCLPSRQNVVETMGAISQLNQDESEKASRRLIDHPRFCRGDKSDRSRAVVSVFIGGDSALYTVTTAIVEALMTQVVAACEAVDGICLITTSRRSAPAVERLLAERWGRHPCCRLLLLASRDSLDGTMEGMLGMANVAVVTGESISMVSEACASGRHVVVIEPTLRRSHRPTLTKHQRFLRELRDQGYVRLQPIPELGHAISRALADKRPPKRLDDYAVVREAVCRLF